MSRFFSTAARRLLEWAGFPREMLPPEWRMAAEKFTQPGGGAEKV